MQSNQVGHSIQRRVSSWIRLLALLSLFAVSLSAHAQKKTQPQNTALCATLFNDPGAGLQNAIGVPGDGSSATYCDSAQFDTYGRMSFSGVAFIDVTDCLTECVSFRPDAYQISLLTRAPTCNGPVRDLRTLVSGESFNVGIVIWIRVPVENPDPNAPDWKNWTEWFVVFGDWPDDTECGALHVKYPCSNGTQAIVTKSVTAAGDALWTLDAPSTEVCLLENAPLSKNDPDPFKLRGRISFPFRIEFTLK